MKRLLQAWKKTFPGSVLLALAASQAASGQALAAADTTALAAQVAAARTAYAATMGLSTVLYDGPEYVDYTVPGTRGNQYFLSNEPQLGTVTYRGGQFAGVPLRYDLVRDQPILLYPGQAVMVALVPGKVAEFTMGSHRFVRVAGDTVSGATLPAGFYEVLVPGPVQLLGRYSKRTYQTTAPGQNLTLEYRQTDRLLLRTPTATAEVSSLKKLLALLPPAHQDELQRFARQQKLKFGPAERAEAATRLLRYYYTLRP